jgi:citrate lyase alpha subunit
MVFTVAILAQISAAHSKISRGFNLSEYSYPLESVLHECMLIHVERIDSGVVSYTETSCLVNTLAKLVSG